MLINAIGTYSASQPLESMAITRRDPGPQDVQIAIAYCGVWPLRSPPGAIGMGGNAVSLRAGA
ncbi:oxidoreductase, zinc-binding dehydrogenase family [Klebsiella pneumoniae subsp. ozaenae]|uniref:Oxidoreductase, zinc-binding dehydrogenase family n=1 Tax=Klebsiella pneumoniae subsp. ozaenae TaxID=574 RepID=A0A378AUA3_KLEPO|nr:oxidoreductase, zinc-binding dehydrogenase family [Klebsiella pneumoniae subsp. ozaenae]